MKAPNSKLRGGAALMLALWALFLLSAMVISWALDINSRLTVSGNASRVLDAEAMASSGADLALHPLVKPDSANLHRQIGNQEGYDVQMMGECGRLNLNLLAPGGVENTPLKEILRQYLGLKGIELNDVDKMVDSLLDWMSPPGLHRLNACPESENYQPPHAALTSVDDLKKICGWAEFTSKPHWDEDFTVSNCGGVLDLVDGTIDDGRLDPPTPFATLGFPGGQPPQIAGLTLGLKNTFVFRVTSVGKSGDVTRTVQMIVSKGGAAGGRPQVMSWKEL